MDEDGSKEMNKFAWHLILCILIDAVMPFPFIYQW